MISESIILLKLKRGENDKERKIVKEIVVNDVKLYKENDKYSVSYALDNNDSKKYTVDNIVYFENKYTYDDIYEENTICRGIAVLYVY